MAFTLHCPVCKQVTGHVADDHRGEVPMVDGQPAEYCSVHHPDPDHRIEDKPTVRMTVRVADDT